MPKIIISILLLAFSIISSTVFSQISSPTHNFKVATSYSTHDSIFIFHQNTGNVTGQLSAKIPSGSPASFEWSIYDTTNRVFGPVFHTESNVEISTISNLAAGGYRVHITGTGIDTSMTGWVFIDSLKMSVEKNNAGEVHFYRRGCDFINLQATSTLSNFKYFNPATGERLTLSNSVEITWEADPAGENTLGKGAKIWIEGDDIPSVDTKYTARATDKFNLWEEDFVNYITIVPKANFDITYDKKYDSKTSAPVTVTFTNNSENATKYTWIFGDGDTLISEPPQKDPEPHTYYISDETYQIKLIAESLQGCIKEDTISITIDPSELEAPNVFSPGSLSGNDRFNIRNVSLRSFHVTIFTRSGRKVYEFSGPDINSWEGWDGKIGNNYATSGIYYYVVQAISWENPAKKYEPKEYSGFFYLFQD